MIATEPPASPAPGATRLSRRSLFQLTGLGVAAAATPLAAKSFGTGFTHNVASGEPGQSSVLLWTRFVGESETVLEWQVAETLEFTSTVSAGQVKASPNRDWCAKAIANGLEPGSWYYYRFIAPDGTVSPVGRTRTLPAGPTAKFRMAVFSCSNFGFGYFNAYAHAAEANDCDLALHLGDYIYEYGKGTYPSPGQAHADRTLYPDTEIVALADYRTRYATYRADPDLQRLHQLVPMIAVWDDHESTNDSWKDGAQNHQPETEGTWEARKAVAKRVYREWMPVSDAVYASYEVGDLATLFRLDTRLEGREEQFNLQSILAAQDNPEAMVAALAAFRDGEWSDPDRQLLGAAQDQWLADALKASTASGKTWQVLVQQVLIGKLGAPTNLLDLMGDGLPPFIRNRLIASAMASQAGLPLNMDAWDGYPAARERVFAAALEAQANLFVVAGDTHNGWAFDLAQDGQNVGVEFGVSSVSSPGFETFLPMVAPDDMAALMVGANDELRWSDTSQRGYMLVELTPTMATTEYRFMAGIKQRSTTLAGTKRMSVEAGSNAISA